MKRFSIVIFTILLLCVLSAIAGAHGVTLIEEKWDNLFETADTNTKYHEVEIVGSAYARSDSNGDEYLSGQSGQIHVFCGADMVELEVSGSLSSSENLKYLEQTDTQIYRGGLKIKFFDSKYLEVSLKGHGSFYNSDWLAYGTVHNSKIKNLGGTLFSNVNLTKDLSLHNSFGISSQEGIYYTVSNGIRYNLTSDHGFQGQFKVMFRDIDNPLTDILGQYRGRFFDRVTVLTDFNYHELGVYIDAVIKWQNIVEVNVLPELMIMGRYDTTKTTYFSKPDSKEREYGIGFHHTLGPVKFSSEYFSNPKEPNKLKNHNIRGQVELSLMEDLKLTLEGQKTIYTIDFHEGAFGKRFSLMTKITYEL